MRLIFGFMGFPLEHKEVNLMSSPSFHELIQLPQSVEELIPSTLDPDFRHLPYKS